MRKSILFAIAGAGLVLTGCNATNHRYQMIPVDDPGASINTPSSERPAQQRPAVETPAPLTPPVAPAPAPSAAPAERPQYTPMSGAVSSGGVDSASDSASTGSAASGETRTHTVKRGENPAIIAQRYRVSLAALMRANNLDAQSAKRLRIGQKLIIPAGGTSGSSASTGTPAAGSSASSASAPALENGQHRVRQGETPEVIARRYKISVRELMAANNLTEETARRLQIGQLLTIPGRSGSSTTAATGSSSSSSSRPSASSSSSSASSSSPGSSNTPAAASGSSSRSQASAGTDIYSIETTLYDVQSDTTYAAVAARYNISEATLRALNGVDNSVRTLSKGSVILVPKR